MSWYQKEINLKPKPRGFHLITDEIIGQLPGLPKFHIGTAHIFICHTSAALTLNENASPDVRSDMEQHFNAMIPENMAYVTHTSEGADDMPAHLKSTIIGCSLLIPVTNGVFNLGMWQGIYLCEHRNHGGSRRCSISLNGI